MDLNSHLVTFFIALFIMLCGFAVSTLIGGAGVKALEDLDT